jgi:hypothetical protein
MAFGLKKQCAVMGGDRWGNSEQMRCATKSAFKKKLVLEYLFVYAFLAMWYNIYIL